ncbi:hypothetical protein TNCT_419971 [Trichonephila clavata]|uniref:Uncharacterized protein n=1 Tax=Trichonephila clavata TaxID=2740835 RepID=A0A8X6FZ50_TRICU|nr:hypothetical protein TNCT_419971 [Trichonephila clavata]
MDNRVKISKEQFQLRFLEDIHQVNLKLSFKEVMVLVELTLLQLKVGLIQIKDFKKLYLLLDLFYAYPSRYYTSQQQIGQPSSIRVTGSEDAAGIVRFPGSVTDERRRSG